MSDRHQISTTLSYLFNTAMKLHSHGVIRSEECSGTLRRTSFDCLEVYSPCEEVESRVVATRPHLTWYWGEARESYQHLIR